MEKKLLPKPTSLETSLSSRTQKGKTDLFLVQKFLHLSNQRVQNRAIKPEELSLFFLGIRNALNELKSKKGSEINGPPLRRCSTRRRRPATASGRESEKKAAAAAEQRVAEQQFLRVSKRLFFRKKRGFLEVCMEWKERIIYLCNKKRRAEELKR